jgi:hypothetical protein
VHTVSPMIVDCPRGIGGKTDRRRPACRDSPCDHCARLVLYFDTQDDALWQRIDDSQRAKLKRKAERAQRQRTDDNHHHHRQQQMAAAAATDGEGKLDRPLLLRPSLYGGSHGGANTSRTKEEARKAIQWCSLVHTSLARHRPGHYPKLSLISFG